MFPHDLRLELAFPIARNLDVNLAEIPGQLLTAASIAGVAAAAAIRIVLLVA